MIWSHLMSLRWRAFGSRTEAGDTGLPADLKAGAAYEKPQERLRHPEARLGLKTGKRGIEWVILLAAGTKGKRFSLPNSRIMIHQPSMEGLAGQAAELCRQFGATLFALPHSLQRVLEGADDVDGQRKDDGRVFLRADFD
jgi:hypothetical protein